MAYGGECSEDKRNHLLSDNDVQQTICIIIERDMIYISWLIKTFDHQVNWHYPFPAFGRGHNGCGGYALTHFRLWSQLPPAGSLRYIRIQVHSPLLNYGEYSWEPYKYYISKTKLFEQKWLEAHNQQCLPILINLWRSNIGCLLPAGWSGTESSLVDIRQYTSIAIIESVN